MSPEIDRYGKQPPDLLPGEIDPWIVHEDEHLLVINKPGWLVCHPSKRGPLSSLVGAARLHAGLETIHLVARLDRETSGIVIFAKTPLVARKYQMALEQRRVQKTYFAVLAGEMATPVRVDRSIGKCEESLIRAKMRVVNEGRLKHAVTRFTPLTTRAGWTTCRVEIETGRRHQIRVHAAWLGTPIAGDKLYGPDENLFIEFVENGWTASHSELLPIKRQALHCAQYRFDFDGETETFSAPIPDDIRELCRQKMELELQEEPLI